MAVKPTTKYTWATGAQAADVVDPGDTKRNLGWVRAGAGLNYGEAPPYQWFNYMQNSYGNWIDYLSKSVDELTAAGTKVTSIRIDGATGALPQFSNSTQFKNSLSTAGFSITGGSATYMTASKTGLTYNSSNGALNIANIGFLIITLKITSNAPLYQINLFMDRGSKPCFASIYSGVSINSTGTSAMTLTSFTPGVTYAATSSSAVLQYYRLFDDVNTTSSGYFSAASTFPQVVGFGNYLRVNYAYGTGDLGKLYGYIIPDSTTSVKYSINATLIM